MAPRDEVLAALVEARRLGFPLGARRLRDAGWSLGLYPELERFRELDAAVSAAQVEAPTRVPSAW